MAIPHSTEFMVENGVCDFPCTPEEERRIVSELTTESEDNLKQGNCISSSPKGGTLASRNMLSMQSKDECASGDSSEAPRPGPIDNNDIIETSENTSDPQLRRLLVEGEDYVLVPQQVWKRLLE